MSIKLLKRLASAQTDGTEAFALQSQLLLLRSIGSLYRAESKQCSEVEHGLRLHPQQAAAVILQSLQSKLEEV